MVFMDEIMLKITKRDAVGTIKGLHFIVRAVYGFQSSFTVKCWTGIKLIDVKIIFNCVNASLRTQTGLTIA